MKEQAKNMLPVPYVSEEDRDKARMKAVSVALGIMGGGCFVLLVIFEPGIIIWAAQKGGIALAIAVMILSIVVPIAYKYDERYTPPPEEDYRGYEMELSMEDIQQILALKISNANKIYWMNMAGVEWVMEDGKVKLKEDPQQEEKYKEGVPMRENKPESGTGDEPNNEYFKKKVEDERPQPLKSIKDHEVPASLTKESELEINQ